MRSDMEPHSVGEAGPEALIQVDRVLRAEADTLLYARGLHQLVSEYGTLHVSGSYALHLMTWRDLDLYLEAPHLTVEAFFGLGARIASLLPAWKMFFTNHRQQPTPEGLRGLYWGIRLGEVTAGHWKIDLWALDTPTCQERLAHKQRIAARLTPGSRTIILGLKAQLWNHPSYRDTITSQAIYDAVLEAGVDSLDGFWQYVRNECGNR
jgi:hypothetical protein